MYIGRLEIFFFVLLTIYLAALTSLICLKRISRKWRLSAYCLFFLVHVFAMHVYHAFHFIERNNASGMRAMDFFTRFLLVNAVLIGEVEFFQVVCNDICHLFVRYVLRHFLLKKGINTLP